MLALWIDASVFSKLSVYVSAYEHWLHAAEECQAHLGGLLERHGCRSRCHVMTRQCCCVHLSCNVRLASSVRFMLVSTPPLSAFKGAAVC